MMNRCIDEHNSGSDDSIPMLVTVIVMPKMVTVMTLTVAVIITLTVTVTVPMTVTHMVT